jgi:hypothetical protein
MDMVTHRFNDRIREGIARLAETAPPRIQAAPR